MFAHLENHHHHWCDAYSIHIHTYHKRCFYHTFQTWKYSEFYSTTNFLAHRSAIFVFFFHFLFPAILFDFHFSAYFVHGFPYMCAIKSLTRALSFCEMWNSRIKKRTNQQKYEKLEKATVKCLVHFVVVNNNSDNDKIKGKKM